MSGDSYRDNKIYRSGYTEARSDEDRRRLLAERQENVKALRGEVEDRSHRPRPVQDARNFYNKHLVRRVISRPGEGVKRVYYVPIDNSGSNRFIATHFRNSTEYLVVNLDLLDPDAEFVFVYFSDHCDGDRWWQAIDYIRPNEKGQRVLASTLQHVTDAVGGDAPEAHECVLWDLSHLDFGGTTERHLILISDVTGHGMGMEGDSGCPNNRNWQDSLDAVDIAFHSFELVGCAVDQQTAELQKQFIRFRHPENLDRDFISLAHIREPQYRLGMVLNTFLFLVARHRGPQAIEAFLSRLYEKWLSDPVFGGDTDRRAKEAILHFARYIPGDRQEKLDMLNRILVASPDELEQIANLQRIAI